MLKFNPFRDTKEISFLEAHSLNDNIPYVFDNIIYYQSLLYLRKISGLGWELSQINIIS